jgi:hypothetical protein
MKKILTLLFIALLATEIAAARVFYYADEADYRNNVAYAFAHPYDGIDLDAVGDFDDYSCISLNDYNSFANADGYDSYDPLTAKNAKRSDLQRLRRDDQLRIINEDPYDSLDENDIGDYDDWNCYTLRDYNGYARADPYDNRRVVDFTHFDDLKEVQKIGKYRYNNFYTFPDDLAKFNLQHTRRPAPYYYPYDSWRSPYPLYGYGVARREDY